MVSFAAKGKIGATQGKDKKMPNSRKGSKKHRGAWLEPDVIDRLREIATDFGTDFTGLLERIGKGEIVVNPKKEKKDNEQTVR